MMHGNHRCVNKSDNNIKAVYDRKSRKKQMMYGKLGCVLQSGNKGEREYGWQLLACTTKWYQQWSSLFIVNHRYVENSGKTVNYIMHGNHRCVNKSGNYIKAVYAWKSRKKQMKYGKLGYALQSGKKGERECGWQ